MIVAYVVFLFASFWKYLPFLSQQLESNAKAD